MYVERDRQTVLKFQGAFVGWSGLFVRSTKCNWTGDPHMVTVNGVCMGVFVVCVCVC